MKPEEFDAKQHELLKRLPMEFHSSVAYYAWEKGHAYGYEEVLCHLSGLVDMLADPIAKFTASLKKTP